MVLFISGSEIFIILAVVLVLFGAKQMPDIAKGFGKGMKEFKKATDDIKREISDADVVKDFTETKSNIEDTFSNFNITEDIVEEEEEKKNKKNKKYSENTSEEETANGGYDYYANSESHNNTSEENNSEASVDDKSEETNEKKTQENRDSYGESSDLQG